MKRSSNQFSLKINYLFSFVLLTFAMLNFDLKAQNKVEEMEIYTIVENMPSFKGCENELNEEAKNACTTQMIIAQINSDIEYPAVAKDAGVNGVVYISYLVDSQGKVGNVEVLKGIEGGEALNAEAVRAVKNLPVFNPGTQRGKAVNVRYILPVNFALP